MIKDSGAQLQSGFSVFVAIPAAIKGAGEVACTRKLSKIPGSATMEAAVSIREGGSAGVVLALRHLFRSGKTDKMGRRIKVSTDMDESLKSTRTH